LLSSFFSRFLLPPSLPLSLPSSLPPSFPQREQGVIFSDTLLALLRFGDGVLLTKDKERREGGVEQTIAGTGSLFFDSHVEEWESWRVGERKEGGREGGREGVKIIFISSRLYHVSDHSFLPPSLPPSLPFSATGCSASSFH